MKPVTPEEALRYCLENPDNLSTEQLLDQFPDYRAELQSLLAVDRRIADALSQQMPAPSRAAAKQKVLASISDRRTAQSTPAGDAAHNEKGVTRSGPRRQVLWSRRPAWVFALLALAVLVWYLSSSALPDSPFYGNKLATEKLLLSVADGPADQARGHIGTANQRLYDLRAMQSSGKLEQAGPAIDSYGNHLKIGGGIWKSLEGSEQTDVSKLLYLSTAAGQRTFDGFGNLVRRLPASLQSKIAQILDELRTLNALASQQLTAAGLNLDQLLRSAEHNVGPLLTPVPGVALVTPTPTPIPCLDAYEDDGVPAQAKIIKIGETQRHLFCPATDADWLMFFANAGKGYKLETSQLSKDVNMYLYLFASDTRTMIDRAGDTADARKPSQIDFRPESDGWYYVQVKNRGDIGYPGIGYSITLSLVETAITTPIP